jgi:hypothetical protein
MESVAGRSTESLASIMSPSQRPSKQRWSLLAARLIWTFGALAVIASAGFAFAMRDFPHGSGAGLWLIPVFVAIVAFVIGGIFWLQSREDDAG